jgi:hypothetical protein
MTRVYFKSNVQGTLTTWESVADTEQNAIAQGFAFAAANGLRCPEWYLSTITGYDERGGCRNLQQVEHDDAGAKYRREAAHHSGMRVF